MKGLPLKIAVGLMPFVCLFTACSFENILPDDLLMTVQEQSESETSKQEPVEVTKLDIPVGENTLNPYEMTTDTSLHMAPLLYDSLTKPNLDFGYDLCVAQSVTMVQNSCTVTLRDDVVFWDGTPLTADDVLYSFGLARVSQNFAKNLAGVEKLNILSSNRVEFVLAEADVLFPNLLDFPIIKNESSEDPVGSGRFYPAEENLLLANDNWYGGIPGKITSIRLIEQPDWETVFYSMKTGSLDYFFVEEDKTVPESGGSVHNVEMPNLIYLGVNDSRSMLSRSSFRRFISLSLDRDELLGSVYYDRAVAGDTPFPAGWERLTSLDLEDHDHFETVLELVDELGLDNRDDEGYIIIGGGRVSLDLLVNGDSEHKVQLAQAVKDALRSAGIEINVVEAPFDEYQARVAAGNYDLYLGEVKLKENFDLTALLTVLTHQTTEEDIAFVEIYNQWRQGAVSLEQFLGQFSNTLPVIPLGTRDGAVYYNREISYEFHATSQDIFYNIEKW